MTRWKKINKELRNSLTNDEFNEAVKPFVSQIKQIRKSGAGLKESFREARAQILESTRISLMLLDAAAFEESKNNE